MATQNNNGQSPASETKAMAVQRMTIMRSALEDDFVKTQLQNALAENSSAFAASLIELYSGDKYLQECDPKLVIMEAIKAAVLKLPISKSLGFAWIIAYKKKGVPTPQFQPGYKGLIQLAVRTSMYRHMNCDAVYEGEYKSANKLTGEFDLNGTRTGDRVIGYFAYFELVNGFSKTFYMTRDQVTKHAERYSKSWGQAGSAWSTDFDAMGKKTVLRLLLSHWGYLSADLVTAISNDADYDAADRVAEEIRGRANQQSGAGFTDAEIVKDKVGETPGEDNTTRPPF